ncbi:L,D-transpeptidase [Sinorhizobium sp. BG8]|uniref:L,D-transpeptidase family protein n=1 Tax=Sinorhizobium sp. BG8 TaxID=2613773 RepID=UPI00193CB9D6|nr:L,D-transpeptidase [Sinorhizobium sp. BG8]QRM56013.1 murein L,D-transpeptidase [Sinorhizobium sp. BG8]
MTGFSVNSFLKTSVSIAALASILAVAAGPVHAQSVYGGSDRDMVLVSPQGDLLDEVPERGSVQVTRDSRGRQVLVDGWGKVVAVVMSADRYFDRAERRLMRRDRYQEVTGYPETSPDYFPPAPASRDDLTTGTVPGGVERGTLPDPFANDPAEEQALPALPDENDVAALPSENVGDSETFVPGPKFDPAIAIGKKSLGEITALQVLLDRDGFSPGVIDGKKGSNVVKAIEAWQQAYGETLDPNNTEDILQRLQMNGGLPFTTYEITAADAAGPYVAAIPEDYAHKAALPHLSYTSTTEMLAEKFHMDEAYLKEMNPGVDFTLPGSIIKVINVGTTKTGKVAKIVADKGRKQVLAYDDAGALIAAYPASIGSSDTPSPSGTVSVERVALNPGYTYNPKINFQQGTNDKILTLPPGPNGPVGTVWIALSKPTYGIHGTPEPSKIGKTQSHGCIRLTNWDATELAKMVKQGVTVEFVD